MNKILLPAMALIAATPTLSWSGTATDYVDVFIGTSGDHGQTDPAATVPFGMVKLGPETNPGNHAGYNYVADRIKGFSHNRISGVGCRGAGGNLQILPGVGSLDAEGQKFNKASEKGSPGFYSVNFQNGVKAELTATSETGFHNYTFPESEDAYILVDYGTSYAGTYSANKTLLNEHEFSATVSAQNVCNVGRYTVNYHVWTDQEIKDVVELADNKFMFKFDTEKNEQVKIRVTASAISPEDAKADWQANTKKLTFAQVKSDANKQWESLLSRIEVEGKEEYKTLFYTHLYHTLLNPVKTENRNKIFRATNGELHQAKGYTHYDTWSVWDNFRNKFSLYALLVPEHTNDFAHSLMDLYKYGKPYWSGFNEPAPTVRTEHSIITLLDWYKRGVADIDFEPLYKKMTTEITNIYNNTPDTKLEQSYDYWALSQIAEILGKKEDARVFQLKADEYKKVWNKKFKNINDKFDIMHGDGLYEGTLWQYRWHVQFDVPGIIELLGGVETYNEQLEYYFENNLHNQGNQPDIHVPFMFNYGGQPWLTQKWVNKILTKPMVQRYGTHGTWKKPYFGRIFKNDPVGYIPEMDDDEGTMSGWYVLSSMGLYPVQVGKPEFQISTPIFDKVTIKLPNNKKFVIKTEGQSDENFYIQSATLNGKPFSSSAIEHSDIANGGELIYKLSSTPNKKWGLN